jgi:hypothetical protein
MATSDLEDPAARAGIWPSLPLEAWQDTYATLHMWTQIVGKIRLVQTPWLNHSWHVTFEVTPCGLRTPPIPHGTRTFQIEFDFSSHQLVIQTSDGDLRSIALRPCAVADFYAEIMATLRELRLPVRIYTKPNEIETAIRFEHDHVHAAYDPDYANRLWRILLQADRVLKTFRARFGGKSSPVHFFWGSFDLAVTRFSGRPAPPHPGGVPNLPDWITRDAYSHEVSSAGFWPGGGPVPYPAFYSYAYPEPPGFKDAQVRPEGAFYSDAMREFFLPYDAVRQAVSPDDMLLEFFQSTYEAAATLGGWDRPSLERPASTTGRATGQVERSA